MKKSIKCFLLLLLAGMAQTCAAQTIALQKGFLAPPDNAKSRVYWFWIYNRVTKEGITRDLEAFKSKGISGVNLICNGGYGGAAPLPGVKFMGKEWSALFQHAVRETKRLHIELGFNMAGGWTMMGPSVTKDDAMKKIVSTATHITGPSNFAAQLPQPLTVEDYYHDIWVQAFKEPDSSKVIDANTIIDLTASLDTNGRLQWQVPPGKWTILRSGYTLTGETWSKWKTYPEGDTFEGGAGYEIDYLSQRALDNYFNFLGKFVIAQAKAAGGHIDYLWSDSWECGKLSWTQDFAEQFSKFRGYKLQPFIPALAGYTIVDTAVTKRFKQDFERTIQDCIAENYYGHFASLCHENGMLVGNEAGGPNDIPSQDVLKNFKYCDILAGEFWVNRHRGAAGGYNKDMRQRVNLKQTASAAHVYGKGQAEAEAFTEQGKDGTHWTLGPSDLKPYANDAFCEGINRFMLHAATSQPPSDGKPGYEYCAGQHFTPNTTWWQQSNPFFTYLSRCQYMLQQGLFVGDVCFYLGEQPPLLAPPKYLVPTLGPGYDCDYSNPDVLLTRMSVKDGHIVLPDGMSYKILVLQNCVSPSPAIAKLVGSYQSLPVPETPDNAMSLPMISKLKELISMGATVIGAPPVGAAELKNYQEADAEVKRIAAEIWGDLDGKAKTERRFGKGRIIWGKTAREVLMEDGIVPDFSFPGQATQAGDFDYIHRSDASTDIYFVINRTDTNQSSDFTFRVTGKQPEIWDPLTGRMLNARSYSQSKNSTTLPLDLPPFGSYFVVFRKPINKTASGKASSNFNRPVEVKTIEGPWKLAFDPKWAGPAAVVFPALSSWTDNENEGIKYYSGTASYLNTFQLPATNGKQLFLELGDVKNVAEISLNGKPLGIVWCAPWRVEISHAVKPGLNQLKITVTNLWVNRVVHDLSLPVEKRLTKTHEVFRFDMLNVHTPLPQSGLLGPVRIVKM